MKDTIYNEKVKDLLKEIDADPRMNLRMLFERFMEAAMKSEREVFLEDSRENKGNGYYSRGMQTGSMKLDVDVPRDRKGKFRPQILPGRKWERSDQEYERLLLSLVESGYSEERVKEVLKKLGLSYNQEKMERIKEEFLREAKEFKRREIKDEWFAIFIDAYETEVREDSRVRKAQVYIVIGIDLEGRKDLLAISVCFGTEKKSWWLELFRDLTSRGLEGVSIIVSDDFSGMREAVKEVFPESKHQLCYVHLMRNIRRNLSRDDASEFMKELKLIKEVSNYEEGSKRFIELCERFTEKYQKYMEYLLERMENYLQFLNLPEKIRMYFYTTNIVESFNSLLERMRYEKGWHFQSVDTLEIGILLVYKHLKGKRWKHPSPKIKAYQYQLNRIYRLQYSEV
jgi:transposase-like protein